MSVDSGYPKTLPGGFSNWPSTWTSVGAAVKWSNGKIYLFRGSEYVRLTGTSVDDGYPLPINGNWNIGFTSDIDYAFLYPNGKAYFFKGNQYTRVTTSPETVDPGYPMAIVSRWLGATF
jgi:predicted P-loop ATPase/GTPase